MGDKLKGLSDLEICQLRLKCLEPFVQTASRAGIEQGLVFLAAAKAWEFCIEPLEKREKNSPKA